MDTNNTSDSSPTSTSLSAGMGNSVAPPPASPVSPLPPIPPLNVPSTSPMSEPSPAPLVSPVELPAAAPKPAATSLPTQSGTLPPITQPQNLSFGPKTGTATDIKPSASTFQPPPIEKSKKSSMGIIVGLVIIILFAGAGYYAYSSGLLPFFKPSALETTPATETTPLSDTSPLSLPTITPGAGATDLPNPDSLSVLPSPSAPAYDLNTAAGRDQKRKNDVQDLSLALDKYAKDNSGALPQSNGNSIKTKDSGTVLMSALVPKYLSALPIDPSTGYYAYESDGATYSLTAALETETDPGAEKVGSKYIYQVSGPNDLSTTQ